MTYSEKLAWSASFSVLVSLAVYFILVSGQASATDAGLPMPSARTIIATIIVMVIAVIAPISLATVLAPSDAEAGPDERDRLIEAKAGGLGHTCLQVLLLPAFYLLFTGAPAATVFHVLVVASALAALAEYGSQIWRYRFGV